MITVTQYKAELKQTQEQKSLDIHIYDVVEGDSYDFWTGETIESETSANHIKNVLKENEDAENINIYINSVGGSVYEGLAIYNQLKRHKAYKTVYVDGMACSIASVIAMAGDKIIMPKASMLMIHNAWTAVAGNAAQLRKAADDLDIMSETISQAYLEKSSGKLEAEELKALLDAESIIKAERALELGLCDEIESNETSDEDKAKSAVKAAMNNALARVSAMAVNIPDAEAKEEPAEEKTEEPAAEPETETESKDESPCDKNTTMETFMNLFTRKAV